MIRQMIPWWFAYNKINYLWFFPVYLRDMTQLETDHPKTFNFFLQGGFAVQIRHCNSFGKIQVLQSKNGKIDSQTPGGTKFFSLKAGTVSRYYITAEYRSTCLRQLRNLTKIDYSKFAHIDLTMFNLTMFTNLQKIRTSKVSNKLSSKQTTKYLVAWF